MKKVTIYTDGACSGNPGPGGWGAILLYGERQKELSGGSPQTTNNIMELTGVIEALKALKEPCQIEIYSDSKYVIQGITEWIHDWKTRGWRNAAKKPVKNKELWMQLEDIISKHEITWHWVKGHADNPLNNRCDELAVEVTERFKNIPVTKP